MDAAEAMNTAEGTVTARTTGILVSRTTPPPVARRAPAAVRGIRAQPGAFRSLRAKRSGMFASAPPGVSMYGRTAARKLSRRYSQLRQWLFRRRRSRTALRRDTPAIVSGHERLLPTTSILNYSRTRLSAGCTASGCSLRRRWRVSVLNPRTATTLTVPMRIDRSSATDQFST